MFHTHAYYQSLNPGAVDTAIPPVPDPIGRVSGNDYTVLQLNRLMAVAAMVSLTGGTQLARLRAPSMLRVVRYTVAPVQGAAAAVNLPADPQQIALHFLGLPQLNTNETLDALVNSQPAAAQIHSVVVWMADGAPQPSTGAEIFCLRATGATALVAGTWTNVTPLTFDDQLPIGQYSIVGMRAQSTNMLAARIVAPGYAWRPGVLGVNSSSHREDWRFRRGHVGEFAQFNAVTLFTVDCLAAAADATQTFEFDVVKLT